MAVAITVVFTSIVGVWALGLGEPVDSRTVGPSAEPDLPDASFSFTYHPDDGDGLRVRSTGGDALPAEQLALVVRDTEDADGRYAFTDSLGAERGPFETQQQVRLDASAVGADGELALDAATVRVVWTSPDGSRSATLAIWVGPDA
ncbi:hypothetical protein N0B31_05590 [Salinirubellus salinus]|uniref:Archaeal Type IV pilin N-terminal domain-containing protein n=2 Tax=Salinirubellus salinus TaxID=1364945 RepID=A0A9E7UC14_9EURY|nr:hypothetical protein [Salinirubellus salinus]UWM55757.1 hypothetical protein N0B31_05590 [Salinirubellus salinus]